MWNENQPIQAIHDTLGKHIQQLRELTDQIEVPRTFGNLRVSDNVGEGISSLPYWEENELVSSFKSMAYDIPLLVEYDWPSWKEGREILQKEVEFPYDPDILQLCKLITMMVRADRFNEGFLIEQFENGNVLRLLRALIKKAEINPK